MFTNWYKLIWSLLHPNIYSKMHRLRSEKPFVTLVSQPMHQCRKLGVTVCVMFCGRVEINLYTDSVLCIANPARSWSTKLENQKTLRGAQDTKHCVELMKSEGRVRLLLNAAWTIFQLRAGRSMHPIVIMVMRPHYFELAILLSHYYITPWHALVQNISIKLSN